MFLLLIASVWLGMEQAQEFKLPPEALSFQDFQDGSLEQLQFVSLFSTSGILTIWFHNIRAIVLAMLLGLFSFGVFGLITLLLAPMLVGYLIATVAAGGLSPGLFFAAFILPHGLFEIPAILIAGAAILKMGANLATPAKGKSIGEAWLRSFANWVKIMIAVVLPLLLIAATIEALITPRIAVWFLSQ